MQDLLASAFLNVIFPFPLLIRLGDVLTSLTTKKETVPYENSRMTQILADSMGKMFLMWLKFLPVSCPFWLDLIELIFGVYFNDWGTCTVGSQTSDPRN